MPKLGFCGDDCESCPRYVATRSGDDAQLKKVAEMWKRVGWRNEVVSPEEIACHGCASAKWCRYDDIRQCGLEKGIDNCGACQAYPCDKMRKVFERTAVYARRCKQSFSKTDYDLFRKTFFLKKENLDKVNESTMDSCLFDQVRAACKTVAESATHVRVNYEYIPSYASSLPIETIVCPELDPERHHLDHGEDTVAFFLTLDAINFGSGYFPHLRKRPGMSGYFTVASSLNDVFIDQGPLSAEELARLTMEDCGRMFDQDPANEPAQELMRLFSSALNDLGRLLLNSFNGSFLELVRSADSSAERLARLLIQMPFFNDVESYGALSVPFYKRAQLTAADLALAFTGEGPGHFEDLDNLTIFADNLVPHVLRVDNVLLYEDALGAHIDAEKLISPGSPEEIEIRACALHAVELIKKEMETTGGNATSSGLDYLLWNRGQQPYYKAIPRHRARTVFY